MVTAPTSIGGGIFWHRPVGISVLLESLREDDD